MFDRHPALGRHPTSGGSLPRPFRGSLAIAAALLVWSALPAVASADAILTGPQPGLGDFGAAALAISGSDMSSDPGGLAPDILGVPSGQTSANATANDPTVACSGSCNFASASADVATGTLRLYANRSFHGAQAQAWLLDTILPQSTGVEHFEITLDGTIQSQDAYLWELSHVRLMFQADSYANGYLLPQDQYNYPSEGAYLGTDCVSGDLSTISCTLGFDVNLTAGDPTEIQLFLDIAAAGLYNTCTDGTCDEIVDLSHTIQLTATGVDFTSASGVFLTQAASVPEPSTFALLAVGTLILERARRSIGAPQGPLD
jgi:hypothetical protein